MFLQTDKSYVSGPFFSKDGILPDTDHITAIRDAPAALDLATRLSFRGLISRYSKFLPNFATVVELMRALLRQYTDTSFQWTVTADRSFHELKLLHLHSPVLVSCACVGC